MRTAIPQPGTGWGRRFRAGDAQVVRGDREAWRCRDEPHDPVDVARGIQVGELLHRSLELLPARLGWERAHLRDLEHGTKSRSEYRIHSRKECAKLLLPVEHARRVVW